MDHLHGGPPYWDNTTRFILLMECKCGSGALLPIVIGRPARKGGHSPHLAIRPVLGQDSYQIAPAVNGTGDVLDSCLELVVIAEVLDDDAEPRVWGSVESFLDVVVPDDRPTDDRNHPEATTWIAVRVLLPFDGF